MLLCPFVVVERLSNSTTDSYRALMLSNEHMMEEIKMLHGCKMCLFLSSNTANINDLLNQCNIEIILCTDGTPVSLKTVKYGAALIRRQMPVQLVTMVAPCT